MLIDRSVYKRYLITNPPEDFDEEFHHIEEKIKIYPDGRMQFISHYINTHEWLKLYLYLDRDNETKIEKIERSAIEETKGKSLKSIEIIRNNVNQIIDHEILKAGDTIEFLLKRYNQKRLDWTDKKFSIEDYDEEDSILDFIGKLVHLVKEIESIESGIPNPPLLSAIEWTSTVHAFKDIIDRGRGSIFEYDDFNKVLNREEQIRVLPPNAYDNITKLFKIFTDLHYITEVTPENEKIKNSFLLIDKKGNTIEFCFASLKREFLLVDLSG